MKTFQRWFTPGSLALAILVATLWLHQLPMTIELRMPAQIGLVCLTYLGLWALTGDRSPRR